MTAVPPDLHIRAALALLSQVTLRLTIAGAVAAPTGNPVADEAVSARGQAKPVPAG
ncbi:hypothetical protein [Actinacidiphila acidipaludis]|uniref:Uncharacterized protein n=1 Tax=Actinacidiphila acidipaludis TaxID=2873382 RepID=A0ABS7QIR5_9ACTN|nr:hypothetical protein [Streptomyces acidipaludis]MBY8883062.1 hypothetical protein [Streptomyces acidipaludis]